MKSASQVTEKQRQTWNKFSSGWEKWDQKVQQFLSPIGDKMLVEAELTSSDRLLDVSTGTGEPGLTAAKSVEHVVATDVAEDMVTIAQKIADKRGIENFETKVADAENLPFSDEEFDVVTCRLGVMFFANPAAGVSEMRRVLKPGRKLVLAAWAEPPKNKFFTVASSGLSEIIDLPPPSPDEPGVFRCSRAGHLSELLEQAGLNDINQLEVSGETVYDSPEEYWELMTDVAAPISAGLSKVDEATREKAKQAVLNATKPFQRDGKVVLTWACWVASGRK